MELTDDEAAIPYHTEVVHIDALVGGIFPCIHIYTETARMARPIRSIRTKVLGLLFPPSLPPQVLPGQCSFVGEALGY